MICDLRTHTQAYITCLLLVYISIVNFNKDIPRAVDKSSIIKQSLVTQF